MGKRSTARRLAMQILFQMDQGQTDLTETQKLTYETDHFLDDTQAFATQLSTGTWNEKEQIDLMITEKSQGWKINRLSAVDRAILRLAIYEMKFEKVPPQIAIDEAINLAKKYSTPESPKFINGILGKLVN